MSMIQVARQLFNAIFYRWTSSRIPIQNEVRKFDSFRDWWASDRTNLLLTLNELRIPLIANNLVKSGSPLSTDLSSLKGLNIVDIGCGGGLVCEPLARLGARVTGIDANENCINYCMDRLNSVSAELKDKLSFFNGFVEDFATEEKKSSVDAIVASEVLEHVPDVESVVKYCYQLLKPNGQLFITTINQTLGAYLLAIIGAENVFGFIPKGTHQYEMLVPLSNLKTILEKNGFRLKFVKGMKYNPWTSKWSWTWSTNVFYALVAEKVPESTNVQD